MNKDQIHDKLRAVKDGYMATASINEQDFIDTYGNNDARKYKGVKKTRADVLAAVYMLSVVREGDHYIFERKD